MCSCSAGVEREGDLDPYSHSEEGDFEGVLLEAFVDHLLDVGCTVLVRCHEVLGVVLC